MNLQATADISHASDHDGERLRTRTANVCMLRVLERVAMRFNAAGIDVMVLKGAALNLTVFRQPDERPMGDLDLMVRPEQVHDAIALLEELGCRPGRPQVRGDFFPRFYYEREFVFGGTYPVVIDLHVRPFRPLRYARKIPAEAFWSEAVELQVGAGWVLAPSFEDMLIHLAAHSAVHANERRMWLADIARWSSEWQETMDWDRFLAHVQVWGLALPVRDAIGKTEETLGPVCPATVRGRLSAMPVSWRDRLALRQAPRDSDHPAAHVLTNALCTPGVLFVLSYLRAVLLPDRGHMGEWYDRRHFGWLPVSYLLRVASPVLRRAPWLWQRLFKIEVRDGTAFGSGVFAGRILAAGERIGSFGVDRDEGKLKHMRHSCRPNTRMRGRALYAVRAIDSDEELTVDHGPDACSCRQESPGQAVAKTA